MSISTRVVRPYFDPKTIKLVSKNMGYLLLMYVNSIEFEIYMAVGIDVKEVSSSKVEVITVVLLVVTLAMVLLQHLPLLLRM